MVSPQELQDMWKNKTAPYTFQVNSLPIFWNTPVWIPNQLKLHRFYLLLTFHDTKETCLPIAQCQNTSFAPRELSFSAQFSGKGHKKMPFALSLSLSNRNYGHIHTIIYIYIHILHHVIQTSTNCVTSIWGHIEQVENDLRCVYFMQSCSGRCFRFLVALAPVKQEVRDHENPWETTHTQLANKSVSDVSDVGH